MHTNSFFFFFVMLRLKHRASWILNICSAAELYFQHSQQNCFRVYITQVSFVCTHVYLQRHVGMLLNSYFVLVAFVTMRIKMQHCSDHSCFLPPLCSHNYASPSEPSPDPLSCFLSSVIVLELMFKIPCEV